MFSSVKPLCPMGGHDFLPLSAFCAVSCHPLEPQFLCEVVEHQLFLCGTNVNSELCFFPLFPPRSLKVKMPAYPGLISKETLDCDNGWSVPPSLRGQESGLEGGGLSSYPTHLKRERAGGPHVSWWREGPMNWEAEREVSTQGRPTFPSHVWEGRCRGLRYSAQHFIPPTSRPLPSDTAVLP